MTSSLSFSPPRARATFFTGPLGCRIDFSAVSFSRAVSFPGCFFFQPQRPEVKEKWHRGGVRTHALYAVFRVIWRGPLSFAYLFIICFISFNQMVISILMRGKKTLRFMKLLWVMFNEKNAQNHECSLKKYNRQSYRYRCFHCCLL